MAGIVIHAFMEPSKEKRIMVEFTSKQNRILKLDLEGGGITFQYVTGQGRSGNVFEVGQSWAGIHALLAKLRNYKTYSAWDSSLSVWMQDQELCLKFRARRTKQEEECKFSPDETARIMEFLERAPNLN